MARKTTTLPRFEPLVALRREVCDVAGRRHSRVPRPHFPRVFKREQRSCASFSSGIPATKPEMAMSLTELLCRQKDNGSVPQMFLSEPKPSQQRDSSSKMIVFLESSPKTPPCWHHSKGRKATKVPLASNKVASSRCGRTRSKHL